MRKKSTALKCEHLFRTLSCLYSSPKMISELQQKTRISPAAFYYTVIPSLKKLGLIEEIYEEGTNKRIIKITKKGRKLLEVMLEIWGVVITE